MALGIIHGAIVFAITYAMFQYSVEVRLCRSRAQPFNSACFVGEMQDTEGRYGGLSEFGVAMGRFACVVHRVSCLFSFFFFRFSNFRSAG